MCRCATQSFTLLLPLLAAWLGNHQSSGQLAWTPIYVDGKSQVDLWTQQAKGCACPWESGNRQCACCVSDGGCHCGKESPNRCTQCGLEQYCNHMCNLTITATELYEKSGKNFGQIKSPSLEGPNACYYTLVPQAHQRVEIQVYRLVNTGRFNGTSCIGGHLQLMTGTEPLYSPHENQLCSQNERYSPPVVFFSDDGVATLFFEITEKTRRSQFLAYFSFTALNSTDGLAFQPRGGMRLQNTDCDWLYQDFACDKVGQCVLASPGYPGVYPPHRQCKYHITTSNEHTLVRVIFTAMLLPRERCATDYVSVYKGTTTSSPLLETLCGSARKTLEYTGSNLLIEFRTGPQASPFEYNGFVVQLEFLHEQTTTTNEVASTLAPPPPLPPVVTHERFSTASNGVEDSNLPPVANFSECDIVISGNQTRSGNFDTREHDWFPICRITFRGRPTDVVHISFFNFRLRAPLCKTVVEVFDGALEIRKNLLEKLCSPQVRQARDPDDLDTKKLLSSRNEIVIFFHRPTAPLTTNDVEFFAGRFYFHDGVEQVSGTVQPTSMCDVVYRGASSPPVGAIDNPSGHHLYWNMEGPLVCAQKFEPSVNQSVTLKLTQLDHMAPEPLCFTQCGDNGCHCVTSSPLSLIDHVLVLNEDDLKVACLCGHQYEWLPVSVRSWSALTLIYSVANYTWKRKGFALNASYVFNSDTICGEQVYTLHTGEIALKNLTPAENLNHFYEQGCLWTLHSNVERQLELDISSKQNRPCNAWNISIHEYSANANNKHLGEVLYMFCSRETHKVYVLPRKVSTVIVRLHTLSRTLPSFIVKWKSQAYRSRENTRFVAPTPALSSHGVSFSPPAAHPCAPLLFVLLLLLLLHATTFKCILLLFNCLDGYVFKLQKFRHVSIVMHCLQRRICASVIQFISSRVSIFIISIIYCIS